MAFGPPGGGGFGGPRGDFGPGTFHAPQFMAAGDLDSDKKVSAEEFTQLAKQWQSDWDKDTNQSLNLDELTKGLNLALASPAPAGAPGGFRPPTGFGPGTFLAQPLLRLADEDKDSAVTEAEWTKLFAGWFSKWDKDTDGQLVEVEVRSGLNAAFAVPAPGRAPQRPQ